MRTLTYAAWLGQVAELLTLRKAEKRVWTAQDVVAEFGDEPHDAYYLLGDSPVTYAEFLFIEYFNERRKP